MLKILVLSIGKLLLVLDMENNPVTGFGLSYNEELIYCEAVMTDEGYEILFNGNWRARIELNEIDIWMLAAGAPLPQTIIDEIGNKIEEHYD